MTNCLTQCKAICCRYIAIPLSGRQDMELAKAREFKTIIADGNTYALVPHVCPKLSEDNKCSIQEKKPVLCRVFRSGNPMCRESQEMDTIGHE